VSAWPRLRSRLDWRGVLHPGPWVGLRASLWAVALAAAIVLSVHGLQLAEDRLGLPKQGLVTLVRLLVAVALVLGIYAVCVRLGERRPVGELALPRLAPELLAGLVGGGILFCVAMGGLLLGGWYQVSVSPEGSPWWALGAGFGNGSVEELVFRGVLMRLLWEAFGLPAALVISSATFGLAHLLNPQHSVMGALSIIVEAGIVLGALFALTGRLWASIGAHAGWNFTQGYVFGADVSGLNHGGHWLHAVPEDGASWLMTGGVFGPEASLVAVVVGAAAGSLLLFWVWRRGAVFGGAG
jgi:uncharacterized protein